MPYESGLYKKTSPDESINFPTNFGFGADSRSLGVISLHEAETFTWRCVPCAGDFGHWMQLGDLVNATITGDLSKVGECYGECWVGQVHYAYYVTDYVT